MYNQIINGIKLGVFSSSTISYTDTNYLVNAIAGVWAAEQTIVFLGSALKAAGSSPLSLATRSFLYLTPVCLSYLETSIKNERLKKCVHKINTCHLPTLSKVAVVASSVGLIVYGAPIAGSISLAYTIIEIAKSKKWILPAISKKAKAFGLGAISTSYLISPSLLDKAKLALVLAGWKLESLISAEAKKYEDGLVIQPYSITGEDWEKIGYSDLKMSHAYLSHLQKPESSSFPALFSLLLEEYRESFERCVKNNHLEGNFLTPFLESAFGLKPPFCDDLSAQYVEKYYYSFVLSTLEKQDATSYLPSAFTLLENLPKHVEKHPDFFKATVENLESSYIETEGCSKEKAREWVSENCIEDGKVKETYIKFLLLKHGIIREADYASNKWQP